MIKTSQIEEVKQNHKYEDTNIWISVIYIQLTQQISKLLKS